MRSLVSLPFFFAPLLSLCVSLAHHLSLTWVQCQKVAANNKATCRQGQEAVSGCLAHALAPALTSRKSGKASLKRVFELREVMKTRKGGHEGQDIEKYYCVLGRLMMERNTWDVQMVIRCSAERNLKIGKGSRDTDTLPCFPSMLSLPKELQQTKKTMETAVKFSLTGFYCTSVSPSSFLLFLLLSLLNNVPAAGLFSCSCLFYNTHYW